MTGRAPEGHLKLTIACVLLFVGGLLILVSASPLTGDPNPTNMLGGAVMMGVSTLLYHLMIRRW
ncbi:hypothetical protein ABZ635_20725 [Nocardiopsis sp. NPDC007018]|uniref:hypothetical protein n=1 Tax=Nocardiopsis sp. NPDC007018 TaxID=3155721 RepID=UPI003401D32F